MGSLLVLQPDGTIRQATPADWAEYAEALRVQAEMWHEIADIERELRTRKVYTSSVLDGWV